MKTSTKKLLAILTLVVLMLGMLPLNISNAATKPTVSVTSAEAKVGDTVTVDLKLDQKVNTASMNVSVKFDKNVLEVTNVKVGSLPNVMDEPTVENSNTQGEVMYIAVKGSNFDIEPGTLGTITFKIKPEAKGGVYNLEAVVNELFDESYEDKLDTITTANGKITVVVPVTGVTLDKTVLSLEKGIKDTEKLSVASTTPALSDVYPVPETKWTSSNTSVATVSDDGTVKAVGNGTADITVTVGEAKATCKVTVTTPVTGIELTTEPTELLKGTSTQLKYRLISAGTPDPMPTVTWKTSDANVIQVSQDGTIKAVGTAGQTATITVETSNGHQDSCVVEVKEIPLDGIAVNPSQDFELFLGDSKQLDVVKNPANSTDELGEITWASSDEDVVTITPDGKVTAVGIGESIITVTAAGKTASITITVPEVLIEGISVDVENPTIEVDGTTTVVLKTIPTKVTESVEAVYTSSDETVATVDENGVIKGLKVGKATIKVVVNGKYEGEVEVEVVETPVTPDTPDTPNNSPLPDTGDIAIGAFVVLMIVSLAGIVLVVKKHNK